MDITKSSKAAEAPIKKMGHTTNGDFGSDPNKRVKGGRPVRDLSIPVAKR